MFRVLVFLVSCGFVAGTLFAQSCPPADGKNIDASQASVLHGTIRFHPGTRPWIGLILPKPACGASEIELAFDDEGSRAKQMDRCSVAVKGVISESTTIYYSADLNIFDPVITPDPGCKLLPSDPDYSKLTIPASIKSYTATMFIDIRGNKRLRGEVFSSGHRLEPWQPYVKWSLNGEEDLQLNCQDSFTLVSYRITRGHGELVDQTAWLNADDGAPASITIVCRRGM
jgi:hypothetical protein